MLASLLPGLRDVRTPLITGYCYALLIWLVFGNNLLPANHDGELFDRIGDLVGLITTTAAFTALSFVCYLVGSVLTIRRLPAWVDPKSSKRFPLYTDDLYAWAYEQADAFSSRGWTVHRLFQHAAVPQSFRNRIAAETDVMEVEDKYRPDWSSVEQSRDLFHRALISEVRQTHDALVTRLQIERETLYNEYDRVRSEAELRFSIFLPLMGVAVASGVLGPPLAFLLAALPVILLVQGYFLYRASVVRVEQAVARGVVKLPVVTLIHEIDPIAAVSPKPDS